MQAYIYQAAFLCEECANKTCDVIVRNEDQPYKPSENSDQWPQGPYANGGGEADCPNHCDHCGVFLENPLTTDGYAYVRESVSLAAKMYAKDPICTSVALTEWAPFYDISLEEKEEPTCDDCGKVLTEQVMIGSHTLLCEECYTKRITVPKASGPMFDED